MHNVVDEVLLLPWAGGPAVVVSAPNEVDDGAEAAAAEADQDHGQVIVPGTYKKPEQVPQHIQTPSQQVIGDGDNILLSPATIYILSVACHNYQQNCHMECNAIVMVITSNSMILVSEEHCYFEITKWDQDKVGVN